MAVEKLQKKKKKKAGRIWRKNEEASSSVKVSDPGHLLKSQGKLFLSFP